MEKEKEKENTHTHTSIRERRGRARERERERRKRIDSYSHWLRATDVDLFFSQYQWSFSVRLIDKCLKVRERKRNRCEVFFFK